jgi:hypothetical protein
MMSYRPFSYAHVPEAAMPKLDAQQFSLLAQLDALNESRTAMGFGQLPRNLDEDTLKAVQAVIQVGISARDEHGVARPFLIPPMIAYRITLALRGGRVPGPVDEGLPVPSR